MDNGPFRMSRYTRTDNKAAPATRTESRPIERPKPETPQTQKEEAPKKEPVAASHKPAKKNDLRGSWRDKLPRLSRRAIIIVVVVVVAALALVAWLLLPKTGIDHSKYQAVSVTNGTVYIGKLEVLNDEYYVLKNPYYLYLPQNNSDSEDGQQKSTSGVATPVLVNMKNDLHGPEDEMMIPKDKVLFFQNLREDSKFAQKIENTSK